jgi:hypothetical protein
MALGAEAEAVRALMAAGVPSDLVARAMHALDVDQDDDVASIGVKVTGLKARLGPLFENAVTPAPFGNKRTAATGPAMSMADAAKEARAKFPQLVPPLPDTAA